MSSDSFYHFIVIISSTSAIDFGTSGDNRYFQSSTSSDSSRSSDSSYSSSGVTEFKTPDEIIREYIIAKRKCYHCKHPVFNRFEDTKSNYPPDVVDRARNILKHWALGIKSRARYVNGLIKRLVLDIIYSVITCNCQQVAEFILMNYMSLPADCKKPDGSPAFSILPENQYLYIYMVKQLYDNLYLNSTDVVIDTPTYYTFDSSKLTESQQSCLALSESIVC